MEARCERKEGVLIFFVTGRLDAFGAQQLDTWTRDALHDDDHELVIDLAGSSYLSSGGIRTFNALKKCTEKRDEMTERAVCTHQRYRVPEKSARHGWFFFGL